MTIDKDLLFRTRDNAYLGFSNDLTVDYVNWTATYIWFDDAYTSGGAPMIVGFDSEANVTINSIGSLIAIFYLNGNSSMTDTNISIVNQSPWLWARMIIMVKADNRPVYDWTFSNGIINVPIHSFMEIRIIDPHPIIVQIYMAFVSIMAFLTGAIAKWRAWFKLNKKWLIPIIIVLLTLVIGLIYARGIVRFII